jgi:hypothetical protein
MVLDLSAPNDLLDQFTEMILDSPQDELPVSHHFGPGIYIREAKFAAGHLVLGHKHKCSHTNILVSGHLVFLNEGGQVKELKAPMVMVSPPGQKLAYIIEDTVWQNVYATEERDVEKLEEMFLEKNHILEDRKQRQFALQKELHDKDISDFKNVIASFGMTEELVHAISVDESDLIDMPIGQGEKIMLRPSPIHGTGVFASSPIEPFEVIGPALLNGHRTPIGRYANHSSDPNSFFVKNDNGDIYMMALKRISGCRGGFDGEEITLDYYQGLKLNGVPQISKL